MQKTNLRASILIWSIFLSLTLTLSFVVISTKVNQNIKLNSFMEELFNKNDKINDLVNKNLEGDITNTEKITKIDNYYTLNNNENNTLTFSGNSDFTGSIYLKNGGPLYYEIFSYSGASPSSTNNYSTGLIYSGDMKNFTGYLYSPYDRVDLSLKNLGGYSSFVFKSSLDLVGTGINDKFTVTKNIGGTDVEKTIIEN
ncbi:MAG: hypothetical protein WC850_00810 [Candidatus Gracilibacteria bacterium]